MRLWQYNYDHRKEIAARRAATQPRRDATRERCLGATLEDLKREFMEHKMQLMTEEIIEDNAILTQVLQERLDAVAWHVISQEKTKANHERHLGMCKVEWSGQSTHELVKLFRSPTWQVMAYKDAFKEVLRTRLTNEEWNNTTGCHRAMRE
jgi:hypothetical protein